MLLAACGTVVSSGNICPEPVPYQPIEMEQALQELEVLGPNSMLKRFIDDYGHERDLLRACRA
jgi:hypothetical protein